MRILVISHNHHYLRDGVPVGREPIIKEINWLARPVDQLIHLACLHPGTAGEGYMPYVENVEFIGLPPAGGLKLREKLSILGRGVQYSKAILQQLPQADFIHVRVPGNLGMYGMILTSLVSKKPRWYKYAGNFMEVNGSSPSLVFQHSWLQHGFGRGPVMVNGRWPSQPKYLHSFINPSFSIAETQQAAAAARQKTIAAPIRIVYAGRLEKGKGADKAVEILQLVLETQEALLDIFGTGPLQDSLAERCSAAGLQERVFFHGWQSQQEVHRSLAQSHFTLLPSDSEGWPKILSEGMIYGSVPIASQVSSIPQIFADFSTGIAIPPANIHGFASAITGLAQRPEKWREMSLAGLAAAPYFSYENYLICLEEMFLQTYQQSPFNQAIMNAVHQDFQAARSL